MASFRTSTAANGTGIVEAWANDGEEALDDAWVQRRDDGPRFRMGPYVHVTSDRCVASRVLVR